MINLGHICVGGFAAFHSFFPSVDIATIHRLPSGLHVVINTSGFDMNSTDGAHTESSLPKMRSPPLNDFRSSTHSRPFPRRFSTKPSELIGKCTVVRVQLTSITFLVARCTMRNT